LTAAHHHAIHVDVDVPLARRLLAAQFPEWADLPLAPVESAGTDNAIFRLGDDLVVRMPRVDWAVGQVEKEQRWLPRIAPHLPLAIPAPVAMGTPDGDYPWSWSVYNWLDGEAAAPGRFADLTQAAVALGEFVNALRQIDAAGGPPPGDHNFLRGEPLLNRDEEMREAIADSHGLVDIETVTRAWEAALDTPVWAGPPVWVHGDLQAANLLLKDGQLSAVIDFGGLGVGDPACDLLVAWNLFCGESREAFRAAVQPDEATWARGRGWALSVAMIQLPYYLHRRPLIAAGARYVIGEVLAEYRSETAARV